MWLQVLLLAVSCFCGSALNDEQKILLTTIKNSCRNERVCDFQQVLDPATVATVNDGEENRPNIKEIQQLVQPYDGISGKVCVCIQVVLVPKLPGAESKTYINSAMDLAFNLHQTWSMGSCGTGNKVMIFFAAQRGALYVFASPQTGLTQKSIQSSINRSQVFFAQGPTEGLKHLLINLGTILKSKPSNLCVTHVRRRRQAQEFFPLMVAQSVGRQQSRG